MDLMEYKAKELFRDYGLPIGEFVVVSSGDQLDSAAAIGLPCMVKAQVQVGGRGKAGGIKAAYTTEELTQHCKDILGMDIKGHTVRKVMVAQRLEIQQEWYLSILLDRSTKSPIIIFSPMGGVDIEETAKTNPEKILKLAIDPVIGLREYTVSYIISKCGLDSKYHDGLWQLLQKLYQLFLAYDCTLCEVNPVGVVEGDRIVAVDAKVSVDDSSLYRHKDILAYRDEMENDPYILDARQFNFLYIPCDPEGTIAVISNGSGMIMSCIDVLAKNGMKVGAALDLGGGATAQRIQEAVRIVLGNPNIKALFINIFGGITRCDEVAGGVKLYAQSEEAGSKIIVVRFEGTNKEQGIEILGSLGKEHIVFADGLYEGVEALAVRREQL